MTKSLEYLPQERRQNWKGILEYAAQVDSQRRASDRDQGFDRRQPRDLVPQSLEEDGQAGGELGLQRVAEVRYHLTHAGDGPFLHLKLGS